VRWLDANPERVLELLEVLKDDPASLVRRSVANNLNDLGKVHPALLIRTCEAWLVGASADRRALVEHALRSAVKRGEAEALRILGFGGKARVAIENLLIEPARVRIGGKVSVSFTLRSKSRETQDLLVDLAVHFVKAAGNTAPKVFKLERVRLAPREEVELQTKVSLAVHTTRVPRAGTHPVDVIVNGEARRVGSFEVLEAGRQRRNGIGARITRDTPRSSNVTA
jgi:hypothetical protein